MAKFVICNFKNDLQDWNYFNFKNDLQDWNCLNSDNDDTKFVDNSPIDDKSLLI